MKGRNSWIVKIGRSFQSIYQYFSFLDLAVIPFLKKREVQLICIVAPPRSGSTLTYQVLTTAFENNHLSNVSNLLYATPVLSTLLQQKLCSNYETSYASKQGFVDGLCGEAEGLKFWTYWMGQGLKEDEENLNTHQLNKLNQRLEKISKKPYITGYLGHAFSMNVLRESFDKVLFIHLKRDLLSNSYSLYRVAKNGPFSTMPKVCMLKKYDSTYDQVLDQIIQIHKVIDKNAQEDTMCISYEELCQDPNKIVEMIQAKASELGIDLTIKEEISPFKVSKVDGRLNSDTKKLDVLIRKL